MARQQFIMGTGNSAAAASAIVGITAAGLTAAGSTQATAVALGADNNFFSTVAASTGAILPTGNPGDTIFVYNGGANSLTVYPPVGGTINNLSANTGLALATTKSGSYVCAGGTTWASFLSA
jgi:hypothetical protein